MLAGQSMLNVQPLPHIKDNNTETYIGQQVSHKCNILLIIY